MTSPTSTAHDTDAELGDTSDVADDATSALGQTAAETSNPDGSTSALDDVARDTDAPASALDQTARDTETFDPMSLHDGTVAGAPSGAGPLALLNDVDMDVTVELGRTTMPIRDLLALQPGMVVEIDRAAGAPIDVLVNGRLIARGEVVVIDEEFGVRISEIVSSQDLS